MFGRHGYQPGRICSAPADRSAPASTSAAAPHACKSAGRSSVIAASRLRGQRDGSPRPVSRQAVSNPSALETRWQQQQQLFAPLDRDPQLYRPEPNAGDGAPRGPERSRILTGSITGCRTVWSLSDVFHKHVNDLDVIHHATMAMQLVKLRGAKQAGGGRGQQAPRPTDSRQHRQHPPQQQPRSARQQQSAASGSSAGKHAAPAGASAEAAADYVSQQLLHRLLQDATSPRHLRQQDARTVANLVSAMARLEHYDAGALDALLAQSEPLLPRFSRQGLLHTAQALAALQHPLPASWWAAFLQALTPHVATLSAADLAAFCRCLGRLAGRPAAADAAAAPPPATATAATASVAESSSGGAVPATALPKPSDALLVQLVIRACSVMSSMTAADVTRLLCGLAELGHAPPERFVALYWQHSRRCAGEMTTSDVADALQAVAALRLRPDASWLSAVYDQLGRLVAGRWALAAAPAAGAGGSAAPAKPQQTRKKKKKRSKNKRAEQRGEASEKKKSSRVVMSVAEVGAIAGALAQLGARPGAAVLQGLLAAAQPVLRQGSAGELTALLESLSCLQFRPSDAWMQAFLSCAYRKLPFYTPPTYVATLKALAALELPPPGPWLDTLSANLKPRLRLCSAQQLADAVSSLATLGYRPPDDWLAEFDSRSHGRLAACRPDHLARLAWALSRFGYRPQAAWLYSFLTATYGVLDAFDARQLGQVFDALPAITPSPAWLDQLVQICSLEGAAARARAATAGSRRGGVAQVSRPQGLQRPSSASAGGASGGGAISVGNSIQSFKRGASTPGSASGSTGSTAGPARVFVKAAAAALPPPGPPPTVAPPTAAGTDDGDGSSPTS